MRGYRISRTAWPVSGAIFNGALLCFLAAFSPLVLAADWQQAAKIALLSTVRIHAINPSTGEICESTGIVIDAGGKILTSNHGIEKFPDLTILVGDGLDTAQYDATLIRSSRSMDMALLQAEGVYGKADLPPIRLSQSGIPQIGQAVAAIGNPLKILRTMTVGVVSAVGSYQSGEFLFFDARIAKGSSGGPLINEQGELVGIVLEIIRDNGADIGKALTVGEIKRFLTDQNEGYIGIGTKKTKTGFSGYGLSEGLEIVEEARNTPFEISDILMTIKGYPINSDKDLMNIVRRQSPGSKVEATILRKGEFKILQVDIVECPRSIK